MSLDSINSSINNSRDIWGASPSSSASLFGVKGASADFEETLKNSAGFGSKNASGEVVNSISGPSAILDDLVSQLQFSLLKNNDASGGMPGRLNNALM